MKVSKYQLMEYLDKFQTQSTINPEMKDICELCSMVMEFTEMNPHYTDSDLTYAMVAIRPDHLIVSDHLPKLMGPQLKEVIHRLIQCPHELSCDHFEAVMSVEINDGISVCAFTDPQKAYSIGIDEDISPMSA